MSYGLNHRRGQAMPPRMARRSVEGSPLAVFLTWAARELASLLVSVIVAIAVVAIVAFVLLAIARACGVMKGHTSIWASIIGCSSLAGLAQVFQEMRDLTRPSPPLLPPVESASGRSSPLWDRELDG